MKYIDINKRFTAIVAEYMAKGYTLNTTTMGGSQGEIANIDLTDGNEIIRVLVCSFHEWDNTSLDGVEIIVGRPTDKAEPNSPVDHVTIWNNRLEVITVERFYQVGEGRYNKKFYGTKNEAEAAQKIRYARWAAREGNRKPQEMSNERNKIIQRAIEIKLDDTCLGFYFFSADDILTVAGIDEARIQEIAAELNRQPPED